MNAHRVSSVRGCGLLRTIGNAAGTLLNRAVDILPVELHLPGYQYCGPGTKLKKRLARGDPGINKLDAACKEHDIAYSKFSDSKNRSLADNVLAERAWERVKATDSNLGERAAAWAITNIMKTKAKLGSGKRKTKKELTKKKKRVSKKKNTVNCKCRKKTQKGKGLYLKPYTGSGSKKKKSTHRK